MGLKMKNVNIMGVHQLLGEGDHKKTKYMGNCQKRGLGQFAGGLAKNKEEGVFEGVSYLNAHYYLILELEIGLADVSTLNFDQSFLQFNAKKKINAKKSSQFEFKC